ncbi:tetratricopeptide repeat protein [Kitasatospora sp. NPDC091335]|uniref:helix-turn-helix domain-containing protein n=1 Tax=Kitasatospora sp. NPDC091335 TaxID=3364085 RepID=UPI003812795B
MLGDASTGEMIKRARTARGWSQERLAVELGKVEGRGEKGPGRGQVYRWEKQGRAPKYWWPHLCEVLEFGSSDGAPVSQVDVPEGGAGDTVSSVLALGRSEVLRREFMAASSGYALAALGLPDLDGITRRVAANSGAPVRVGRGEVLAVRQMVKSLSDAASELGGGHARHLAVHYLAESVAPWLDGVWSEFTGRELFAGAAQLTHLIGWMAQDEGNHGVAQKYYAHSYRLAAEAGDAELAATALRGLAVQAVDLGYRVAAVRIAEECVDQAKRLDDPKALAYYETTLADAAAQDGDRTTATRFLTASQRHIERSSPVPGDSWASHFSIGRWAHHSGMILARLGDFGAARDHLQMALDVHGLDRRRSHAIVLADLGTVQVRQENYEAALSTWSDFLALAEGVRSVKVDDAVTDMRARLARVGTIHGAAELDERAACFLSGRSG